MVQKNYDKIIPMLVDRPTVDRTVPVLKNKETGEDVEIIINEELDVPQEVIIPSQDIEEVVNKFDAIAVGHCFDRHLKDLLGDPCKMNGPRENCFTFGKSAHHVAENGFGRLVSKEEAMKIMREAEEAGLIHKAGLYPLAAIHSAVRPYQGYKAYQTTGPHPRHTLYRRSSPQQNYSLFFQEQQQYHLSYIRTHGHPNLQQLLLLRYYEQQNVHRPYH